MTDLVRKHRFPSYHASSILSFVDKTAETWELVDLVDIVVWAPSGRFQRKPSSYDESEADCFPIGKVSYRLGAYSSSEPESEDGCLHMSPGSKRLLTSSPDFSMEKRAKIILPQAQLTAFNGKMTRHSSTQVWQYHIEKAKGDDSLWTARPLTADNVW